MAEEQGTTGNGGGAQVYVISDNRKLVADAIKQGCRTALEAIGLEGERDVVQSITSQGIVDTGRLRDSITHNTSDTEVEIGTNVEYAVYVEEGTSKMPARPYLVPTIENNLEKYRKYFEEAFKNG